MSKDITDELIIREETSGYSFEKSKEDRKDNINNSDVREAKRILDAWSSSFRLEVGENDDSYYIDTILKYIKQLEEELKEEKELNKIIKDTKLDELLTTPRRNGKTIELAMKLREELLKLPECKLYGIKNCKNKIFLVTKEECIPISLVEKKIEERKLWLSSNDIGYKDDYVLEVLQELLEKR